MKFSQNQFNREKWVMCSSNSKLIHFCHVYRCSSSCFNQMERFAKITRGWKSFIMFVKRSILDVWQVLNTPLLLLSLRKYLSRRKRKNHYNIYYQFALKRIAWKNTYSLTSSFFANVSLDMWLFKNAINCPFLKTMNNWLFLWYWWIDSVSYLSTLSFTTPLTNISL